MHLYFVTVRQQPIAALIPVVLLAFERSAGFFPLPIWLLEPLGPETAILPVDDGIDFVRIGVDYDVMLAQIVMTEDVASLLLLCVGLRPPAAGASSIGYGSG